MHGLNSFNFHHLFLESYICCISLLHTGLHDYMTVAIYAYGKWEGAYIFLPALSSPAVLEAGLTLAGQIKRYPRKNILISARVRVRGRGCYFVQ